jgi:hypothetical protein
MRRQHSPSGISRQTDSRPECGRGPDTRAAQPGEIAIAKAGVALARGDGMLRAILGLVLFAVVDPARAAAPPPPPVVGGERVPPGRWRDVVAVVGSGGACTGTLIAPDVVLTAGHCIAIEPAYVVADSVDFRAPGGERIAVAWARAYPDWEHRYDIGLLRLERAAPGAPRVVASACTVNRAFAAADVRVRVVGFGLATEDASDDNSALREAELAVTDPTCTMDAACEPSVAPRGEFVAGGDGRDSCFGDSGGPVNLDTANGPVLIGVVSRGRAIPGLPCGGGGIYVRADKVAAWARSITRAPITRTSCGGAADDPALDGGDAAESGADHATGGDGGGCASAPGTAGAALAGILGTAIAVATRRRRRRPDRGAAADPAARGGRSSVVVRGRSWYRCAGRDLAG